MAATKKKKPGRPSKKLPTGNYKPLKTSINDVTIKDIDNIAKTIEEGCFIPEACVLNGVEHRVINNIITNKAKNELGSYTDNAFKIAKAKSYKKLTEEWLDKNSSSYQKKNVQDFLLLTNSSYSKRYRKEIDYNLELILDAVEKYTDEEAYLKILEYIKATDQDATLREYDSKKIGEE